MLEQARLGMLDPRYRALGLNSNPFRAMSWHSTNAVRVELITHAAATSFAAAIDASASDERHLPVWVLADDTVADMYNRMAVSETVYSLSENKDARVLVINVPFILMRLGRVRSALGLTAERVTGKSFGETLGAYCRDVLGAFDRSLPEAEAIPDAVVESFVARFTDDPDGTAEEVFGERVDKRPTTPAESDPMNSLVSQTHELPTDPDEATDGQEDADTTAEAGAHEASDLDPVARYVIAHTRAHLSPVVARALETYVRHGADAAAQELKVTKAPMKTLRALVRFAGARYRAVVIAYYGFDDWEKAPDDLKVKVATTLAEMRMRLKSWAIVSIIAGEGVVPELEEQFAGARRVEWDLRAGLSAFEQDPRPHAEVVESLLAECAYGDGPSASVRAAVAAALEAHPTDLESFAHDAGRRIDELAEHAVPAL